MTPTLKLPLAFDTKDLQGDLANFSSADWVPHFNIHYYRGRLERNRFASSQ
jgi:hypothetical protein